MMLRWSVVGTLMFALGCGDETPTNEKCVDADGDGYGSRCEGTQGTGDCDDANAAIHPGAVELDNGIDNDCDGDAIELDLFDTDADGFTSLFGNDADQTPDCDDEDPTAHPGATEVCDEDLETCGGTANAGCNIDGDNFCGNGMNVVGSPTVCSGESGGDHPGSAGTDCDDGDATAYPGATELCDNDLEACGQTADHGCNTDGDDFCSTTMDVVGSPTVCPNEAGGVHPGTAGTDCDDDDITEYPGATEVCDDDLEACGQTTDDGCNVDGDLYCATTMAVVGSPAVCSSETGGAYPGAAGTDCADDDATAYPGAFEVCDDDLEACGETADAGCNVDGDEFCAMTASVVGSPTICPAETGGAYPGSAGTDCDDDDAAKYPGASDTWYAVGNRVWLDEGHSDTIDAGDGWRDTTEVGIGGVTVELFADVNINGVAEPDAGDGAPIATTTTSDTGTTEEDGYYLFDDLAEGSYFVRIPAANFDEASDPLWRLYSSDGPGGHGLDNQIDSDGLGGDENGHGTDPRADGITSTVFALTGSEPTGELDRDPNLVVNVDGACVRDEDADFTLDFAFYGAMSVGNRTFYDQNRNGFFDFTDVPIANVTVYLFTDEDSDGTPDGGPLATEVTDATGYYLFDETDAGELIHEGTYVIGVDPVEFDAGQELESYASTVSNVSAPLPNPNDTNDDGRDRRDAAGIPLDEVMSATVTLIAYGEPTNDDDIGPQSHGRFGISDQNSNLTHDFGFFIPLSIGNRVWADSNNSQTQDPGETGLDGVLMNLYQASAPWVVYRSTVTTPDAQTGESGYFLFDDLPEGDYLVEVAPANFWPSRILYNATIGGPYYSSEDTDPTHLVDNGGDRNDNGIDDPFPGTNGVRSRTINLSLNAEPSPTHPADDLDLDTTVGEGTFGELDVNGEMTIDFGFYIPATSLGNRVFFDNDDNRQLDGTDAGIDGVFLQLFATDGAGNVIDQDGDGGSFYDPGDVIATDLTDANGYYIFDGLRPGFYIVMVAESNFASGGTLEGMHSSQDSGTPSDQHASPFHDNDAIEDGIDSGVPMKGGIRSPEVELVPGDETPTETDLGPDGNGEPNVEVTNSNLTIDFGFTN